eukprot:m.20964 g.20964  ORF g.20964 m.20964 type:complete len:231 (+) comp11078_c0_seq1:128-820(+)
MDEDGLVILGDGVNHYEVEPLSHKRMLAFVNHFVTTTASFLNHFSTTCEQKLTTVSDRLQKLEITMSLLENKLDSIDGLGDVTAEQYVSTTTAPAAPAPAAATTVAPVDTPAVTAPAVVEPAAPTAEPVMEAAPAGTVMTNRQDPRFARYFKMVDMGVPVQAVKGKFAVETGCDPNIMDNPDAPSNSAGGAASKNSDTEESEESDFTDDEDQAPAPAAQPESGSEAEFSD